MIVLGIDPGTRTAGFGVVELAGKRERALDYGAIPVPTDQDHSLRLQTVYDRVIELADAHLPDACAVEVPYMGKNPQSMIKLVRAQGAVMLAAMHREIPIVQYTPAEIKKAVVGKGQATKDQVWFMVRNQLGLTEDRGPDASDALAIALCHARRLSAGPAAGGGAKDWAAFIAANPGRVR